MARPFSHIAVCVAESPHVELILDEAERLRGLGEGRLSVVHVVEPPVWGLGVSMHPAEVVAGAGEWLDEQAARLAGAQPVLLEGQHAGAAVREWAQQEGVDLIVASAHRGLVERLLLGGFAAFLAYHAPCSVHIVRPPEAGAGSASERSSR
jgi:nucleotide-binding universal stress UspA family protein